MNPNKALWEKGDFTRIAETMRDSGEELVKDLGITSGLRVLDLGSGDGTTAIPAARARRRRTRRSTSRPISSRPATVGPKGSASPTAGFKHGDATDLADLADDSFDLVVSIFGAMFAPKPFEVAKELVRVTRPGGRIVMGNWIPNDPTLVAQILKISGSYSPPPPEGFISPVTWGIEANVIERFTGAGVPEENISFERKTYTFDFAGTPSEFLAVFEQYYGPTMNAVEAATKNGKEKDLHAELDALFNAQNTSTRNGTTSIPATFLRVTATK